MQVQKTYPNAPIIEAVVEFRFENSIDEHEIKNISSNLSRFLPDEESKPDVDIQIDLNLKDHKINQTSVVIRSSSDQTRLAVIRPNSLICSVKAPYKNFEDFENHISDVWESSYRVTGFRKIVRVGMRYINRIDLLMDDGKVEYEDYLNLKINLPNELELITSYDINFAFEIPEIKSGARIHSNVVKDIVINHASFFLDIDIGRLVDVPQKRAEIFALLREFRSHKNRLFETFITDKARALFHAG